MNTATLPVDHVKTLRDAFAAVESANEASKAALGHLHLQAMEEVRGAFSRVFGANGPQLPEGKTEAAVPHAGNQLQLEFPIVFDIRLLVDQIIDQDTGITFDGIKVQQGIRFLARVPLKHLSPTGIEKI